MRETQYDVCIVGAGVAGASAAAYLGRHGLHVAIIERYLQERDVIVGELLQPGGVQLLKEMDLGHFLDGMDAQPVFGYNVIFGDENCLIDYPAGSEKQSGFGFRNGKFVQNMRNHIKTLPTVDVLEGKVTSLIEEKEKVKGVRYMPKGSSDEAVIPAALTIVSDGPASRFRKPLSKPDVKISGYFLGIILEDCDLPNPNYGHLVMGDHPPFVLYPVNSSEIRILIDFPGERAPRAGSDLKDQLMQIFYDPMPDSLKPAFQRAVAKGKFKMMPNHRLPANPKLIDGAVLLGDSLNMRHPLTGGGMTAAFSDVKNLCSKLVGSTDFKLTSSISKTVEEFYESRHIGNQTINILADALYGVVQNADLRMAFFEYVKRGGVYADEPMSLLGGLSRDKRLLIKHFFAVANYGTRIKIRNEKGIRKFGGSIHMLKDAVSIISPLLKSEKPDPATKIVLKTIS